MKKHTIRIVGGDYRRTLIPVADVTGLRPTPDRVRETLFNWINHFWAGEFSDKHVLDLFAGTGALGFEAASRGAAHVQMVESNASALAALRTLRNKLNAMQVRIHSGDATMVLERLSGARYDLVLLDPPFGQGWLEKLWALLPAALTPNGLLYVEAEHSISPPDYFETLRSGKAGHVHFQLLRFAAAQETVNNPKMTPTRVPAPAGPET